MPSRRADDALTSEASSERPSIWIIGEGDEEVYIRMASKRVTFDSTECSAIATRSLYPSPPDASQSVTTTEYNEWSEIRARDFATDDDTWHDAVLSTTSVPTSKITLFGVFP